MKLYLMRHGQAASPELDPQQGLSQAGRDEISRLAERMSEKGIVFEQVLHSEKMRAQQTAEIMTDRLGPGVSMQQRSGIKPNDDPSALLADINSWTRDTLLVSHLPFVPNLLSLLIDKIPAIPFHTGTLVCLQKEAGAWRLEWVESP